MRLRLSVIFAIVAGVLFFTPENLPGAEYLMDDLRNGAPLWTFDPGRDFPGAAGALEKRDDGVLVLKADFEKGGQFVGAQRLLEEPIDFSAVRFQIRTPAKKIGFRVFDASGQTHQHYLELSGNPEEFQTITVEKFAGSAEEKFFFWGGAADGKLVLPIKAFTLLVSEWDVPGSKRSETEIRGVGFLTSERLINLNTRHPETLFFAPGTRTELSVDLQYFPGTPSDEELEYRLLDFDGQELGSGVGRFRDGVLSVDAPEGRGFFEYDFPHLGLRFGAVALPDFEDERDRFFGMDAVFSGFTVYQDEIRYRGYLELLRRGGISSARDRMYWWALEPNPGIDWNGAYAKMAERKRQLASEYGIAVLELFHDTPPYVLSEDFVTGKYPVDLQQSSRSWREIAARWGRFWQALEVWNEPDHGFLPGDQQTAFQKAVSYAAYEGNPGVKLVGGVFSGGNTSPEMIGVYVRNGLLEVSDAISFHNYDPAGQLESRIAAFRRAFGDSPRAGIPLELTECGWPWPSGSARADAASDRKSAIYIAMKAVEARCCGVASYHPFVLGYYDEGVNNFAMIDRNSTPMRSIAAYWQCVRMLANKEYIGDWRNSGNERARVFRAENGSSEGEWLLVLYNSPDKNLRPALPDAAAIRAIYRTDGSEIAPEAVSEKDALLYLLLNADSVAIDSETTAMGLLRRAEAYQASENPRSTSPVVLQGFFAPDNITSTVNGYFPIQPERLRVDFRVNNLGSGSCRVPLELVLPAGTRLLEGNVPDVLTLEGGETEGFSVTLDLSDALEEGKYVDLVLQSTDESILPLVLPLTLARRLTANAKCRIDENAPYSRINPDGGWFYWGEPVQNHRIEGEFRWFYNPPGELILDVRVTDRTYNQPFELHEAWKGDSVQLAIQPLGPGGRATESITEIVAADVRGTPGIFRYSSCRGNAAPEALKKSRLEFRRDGDQQYYRLILDIDELGLDSLSLPKTFGASLLINSNDGTGRVGYLQWGGGIGAGKNPNEFNRLKLIP